MTIRVRAAVPSDTLGMTAILNDHIAGGTTTAHQSPFTEIRMERHYIAPPNGISCFVAQWQDEVVGFQSLAWPNVHVDTFARGWAIIASFAAAKHTGRGIGRLLFSETRAAAIKAGVVTIDATIRADNIGGLAYYDAIGFVDYRVKQNVALSSGNRVDRICKRYDLR